MVQGELIFSFDEACELHVLTHLQIWEYFLAYSTIISREGGATCYQIVLQKNINGMHRADFIPNQFGLSGSLSSSKGKTGKYT